MVSVILQISIHFGLKWEKKSEIEKEKIQSGREGRKPEKDIILKMYFYANKNHSEVPLHTSQDGYYPKVYK